MTGLEVPVEVDMVLFRDNALLCFGDVAGQLSIHLRRDAIVLFSEEAHCTECARMVGRRLRGGSGTKPAFTSGRYSRYLNGILYLLSLYSSLLKGEISSRGKKDCIRSRRGEKKPTTEREENQKTGGGIG